MAWLSLHVSVNIVDQVISVILKKLANMDIGYLKAVAGISKPG